MTDIISSSASYQKSYENVTKLGNKFDSNIESAIQAEMPLKDKLTREQFKSMVLYVMIQKINKK